MLFGRIIILLLIERGDADGGEDEVNDGVSEDGDDEADDSIKDGVFSVGDLFAVAAGNDIAKTAIDKHDDGNKGDEEKDGICDLGKDAVVANELGGHTFGTSSFSAFADADGHSFASPESEGGASPRDDLRDSFINLFHIYSRSSYIYCSAWYWKVQAKYDKIRRTEGYPSG